MKNFAQYLIEVAMSSSDARKVLGLSSNYTDDQLKTAYKKMAVANHPDKGGSVAKMQQINVARDVLAGKDVDDYDDYDNSPPDDGYNTPYPQTNDIRYMMIFLMFREELGATVRSKVGHYGQIQVPLMSDDSQHMRNGNPVVLVIQRQKNMLGTEYVVQGIYESKGGVLKAIIKFSNINEDMAFWESRKSVFWFIKKLQSLRTMSLNLAQTAGKLQELLKYYSKNADKLDSNVRKPKSNS